MERKGANGLSKDRVDFLIMKHTSQFVVALLGNSQMVSCAYRLFAVRGRTGLDVYPGLRVICNTWGLQVRPQSHWSSSTCSGVEG